MSFPEPSLGQVLVPIFHFGEDGAGLGRLDLVESKTNPVVVTVVCFRTTLFLQFLKCVL
jgi:hypothetical protein